MGPQEIKISFQRGLGCYTSSGTSWASLGSCYGLQVAVDAVDDEVGCHLALVAEGVDDTHGPSSSTVVTHICCSFPTPNRTSIMTIEVVLLQEKPHGQQQQQRAA